MVAPSAPEAPPPEPPLAARPEARQAVREGLAELTNRLGRPLPRPSVDDPVGIDVRTLEESEVEVPAPPPLAGFEISLRARAYKGRVHTLEASFRGGCDADCGALFEVALAEWLGAPHIVDEGRAHIVTVDADTVRVELEHFPHRPELARIVVTCLPLKAKASHRPSLLPEVGEPLYLDPSPACRPLPAEPLAPTSPPPPS